jgi:hypothetical protein
VEDYLIQRRGFWFTLSVVLKPSLLALPCVSREHTQGVIVKCRGEVAWLGGYQGYCALYALYARGPTALTELMSCPVLGGIGNDVVLPAVAMLALAGPSRRRKCPDVASANSGIESFSSERGARSM